MKNRIGLFVLSGVVLLLLLLSALALSIKSALWFQSMMVDRWLAEVHPGTEVGLRGRLGTYAALLKAGNEAARQLKWAHAVWDDPNSAAEDHYKAAIVIVTDLCINKEEWLTLGNIVKHLGVPGDIDGLFPITDGDCRLLVIPYDFNVFYSDRRIRFVFSLSGFLQSVLLVTPNGAGAKGAGKLYWPDDYTRARGFPVYAGFEYDEDTEQFIVNRTRERVVEAVEKGAFFRNIEALTVQEKALIDSNNMTVYMVDGINEQMAIAYFAFRTKDLSKCYSMWFYQSDGQWCEGSALRNSEIIRNRFAEEH